MGVKYTVSDGKLMLVLEVAEEGGYIVTSPLDPQLVTQAETLEEAFDMAYDAREHLIQGRAELARRLLGRQGAHSRDSEREPVIPPAAADDPPPPSPASLSEEHVSTPSMAPKLRSLSFDSGLGVEAGESES